MFFDFESERGLSGWLSRSGWTMVMLQQSRQTIRVSYSTKVWMRFFGFVGTASGAAYTAIKGSNAPCFARSPSDGLRASSSPMFFRIRPSLADGRTRWPNTAPR
jgi:hypothetical protein